MVEREEIEAQEPKKKRFFDQLGPLRYLCCLAPFPVLWLIWVIFIIWNSCMQNPEYIYTRVMARALKAIGSSQIAYQAEHGNNRMYGSFEALQEAELIAKEYTLGNIVNNYSMTWEVNNISTVFTEDFPAYIISTFTVIAYPKPHRFGERHLQTFAVTEDQVVRVYNPPENDLDSIYHWDPIL